MFATYLSDTWIARKHMLGSLQPYKLTALEQSLP